MSLTTVEKENFINLLNNPENTENHIQDYLENHSILIPLPFLLNHHLHMNSIISKFKIGNEYITDLAYLTKSSDFWYFVLIELEDPKKRIFTKDNENIYFHSDFNHAYDQVTSWKAYISQHTNEILNQIDKLRVPLNENNVIFKYVLIYGRSEEKSTSTKRTAMFAQKSTEDIRVMTYDSLISNCETLPYNSEKIILSPWRSQGFKIKTLPNEISTSIFGYLTPDYLSISSPNIEKLKEQDYQIDSWMNGKLLNINKKYDEETFAQKNSNPLFKEIYEKN